MVYTTQYGSPIGQLWLASDGERLIGLWMEGQKYFGASAPGVWVPKDDLPVFAQIKAWLDDYFAGGRPALSGLPLALHGSAFRKMVWAVLCEIAYGQTTTYGQIAQAVARRMKRRGDGGMLSRAVGGAVGHNPVSIIVPCHRVLGSDGGLTGYAGGLERKVHLLALEGAR
ncbi:MAG: methylated-DNA--[protein]-cysteine S-methyltransferase [Burkholderiaceae bacterium]|jgi:methylated-DNA-[protein]-cysteine S-methyltransferase|nr:methylated-DNA--[protein]-cysteine S-methyltransferase [Burkholderiaceae bacterium]